MIRIEDDGCGMSPEDALLSLERHATSKLQSVDDLQALLTMGFRGEALAAIAAVSQLELKTSNGVGTRLCAEGGILTTVEPCARNRGTTIEIRSLFYNVPARKKFQKSVSSNTAQVGKVVELFSLGHPEVFLSLISNGKKVFEAKEPSLKARIEEVAGSYEHEIAFESQEIRVSGFIGSPAKAMANRSGQYLFINRRPIFSPLVAKAVKEGFGTRISEHTYPSYVLFLEVPPDRVDVNVHPQKREVRFRDEGAIFRAVQEAVLSAFAPSVSFSEPLSFSPPPFSFAEQTAPSFLLRDEPLDLSLAFSEKFLAIFGKYLLLEKENWILVDLAAARARILFETLKEEKGARQALMWPLEVPLRAGEEGLADELDALGIECRWIGQKILAIDALPLFLEEADFPTFLESWREDKRLDRVAMRFCQRRQKHYLLDEAKVLWQQLQKCRDQLYDPLGNRIWSAIKEEDLARILAR
jgi:DNA mismatch repair protein MutL